MTPQPDLRPYDLNVFLGKTAENSSEQFRIHHISQECDLGGINYNEICFCFWFDCTKKTCVIWIRHSINLFKKHPASRFKKRNKIKYISLLLIQSFNFDTNL